VFDARSQADVAQVLHQVERSVDNALGLLRLAERHQRHALGDHGARFAVRPACDARMSEGLVVVADGQVRVT
jgi:hypothetical protein